VNQTAAQIAKITMTYDFLTSFGIFIFILYWLTHISIKISRIQSFFQN
jgi:hypothetical protein